MKKALPVAAVAAAMTSMASGSVLWENGGMITHPGQGFNGADVSMADANVNIAGTNGGTFGDGSYFRRADNFTVGGGGWNLDSVTFYLYSTGGGPTATPWAGFDMNIWSGLPGTGSVVANSSSTIGSPEFTNIYRVFNGQPLNNQRAVFSVTMDFSGVSLGEGEHWIDLQVDQGTGSAWIPVVMNPDGTHYNGDQMQFTADGEWVQYIHADSGMGADMPFEVHGQLIPGPGALALLGLAGLAGVRRRRA